MKNYLNLLLFFLTIFMTAQNKKDKAAESFYSTLTKSSIQSLEKKGVITCYTTENEKRLKQKNTNKATTTEFENWLAPKTQELKKSRKNGKAQNSINIPVIFHVLTNGTNSSTNLSESQIQDQIDQLNLDYSNQSGSSYDVAADTGVRFCLAEVNNNGEVLAEKGINRITSYGDGPFSINTYENTIKPATQWNPNKYMNVWCSDLENGLLGWAQFPEPSGGIEGLDQVNNPTSNASTDGVVILSISVGSKENPHPAGEYYSYGINLTHETGHFLGLRHTWGDGDCSVDDYCDDTPTTASQNFECPTRDSCTNNPGNDMVENYMEYTDDYCKNTFTQDQVDRITIIMANSPRRVELTTSNACSSTPLLAIADTSEVTINEGNDCSYTDIIINLTLSTSVSSEVTSSLTASGDATINEDFEILNNSVTFSQGNTAANNAITVRIYNDDFIESDETIILSINSNSNNDVEISQNTKKITILNDDSSPLSSSDIVFSDDFESYNDFDINAVGEWTSLDNDGDATYLSDDTDFNNEGYTGSFIVFNATATTPASNVEWEAHGGDKGYYCFNSTGNSSGTPLNDDYIFTPQINLNGTGSELKFWAKSLTNNYNGGERFQVGISTTNTTPSSFTYISTDPYVIPPLEWTEYTYDLSAYDGQNIYITIHVVSSDEFIFMMDDFIVTTSIESKVQEIVNTTTADNNNLNSTGSAGFNDSSTNNIMLNIDNTGGIDYGCTSAWVSRDVATAGAAAVMYSSNTNVNTFVTAKTFSVTTENTNTTGTATVSFYFTEDEIENWETITGNNRSNIVVIKESITEAYPVTISSFGDDLKLSAIITSGLAGDYYFGTQGALSNSTFNFQDIFSIYPNPANNVLNIKASDNNIPDSYKIYNMLGQLIKAVEINATRDLTVNTSAFSNGMYFIKITKDNNSISIPFIKE